MEIAKQINANPILKQIYKSLSDVYHKQGSLEQAYDMRLLYDQAKDYVYNEESSRKLAQLEVAFEFQKKEKELEIIKQKQEINELRLENSRIVILIGVMGTILLLAVGFTLYNLKREKKLGNIINA